MPNRKLFYFTLITYPFSLVWIYLGVQLMAGSFIWFVFTLFLLPFLFIPLVREMLFVGWNQIFLHAFDTELILFILLTFWLITIYGVYIWEIIKSRLSVLEKISWCLGMSLFSPILAPFLLFRLRDEQEKFLQTRNNL